MGRQAHPIYHLPNDYVPNATGNGALCYCLAGLWVNQFDYSSGGGGGGRGGRKISLLAFVECHWLRIKYFIELWPQVDSRGALFDTLTTALFYQRLSLIGNNCSALSVSRFDGK